MMKRRLFAFFALLLAVALPLSLRAETTMQFPTTPWGAFAPTRIQCGTLRGANFNITTDQPIPIAVPSATYVFDTIEISNPSVSLTTAQGGFYTGAGKTGTAVVASSQAYSTLTTKAVNAAGNLMTATISTAGATTKFQAFGQASQIPTLYLSLTTGQGAAATADVRVFCRTEY